MKIKTEYGSPVPPVGQVIKITGIRHEGPLSRVNSLVLEYEVVVPFSKEMIEDGVMGMSGRSVFPMTDPDFEVKEDEPCRADRATETPDVLNTYKGVLLETNEREPYLIRPDYIDMARNNISEILSLLKEDYGRNGPRGHDDSLILSKLSDAIGYLKPIDAADGDLNATTCIFQLIGSAIEVAEIQIDPAIFYSCVVGSDDKLRIYGTTKDCVHKVSLPVYSDRLIEAKPVPEITIEQLRKLNPLEPR